MQSLVKTVKPRQNPASPRCSPLCETTPANQALATFPADASRPSRFSYNFSKIPIHPPPTKARYPRLAINEPGDQFEQEADEAAAAIIDGADLAHKPALDSSNARPAIRLRRGSTGATSALAPKAADAALHSPWQPLEAGTRRFMEHRFGHDFSRVRIHADLEAADSARSVGALAYTAGHDVVFGAGRYQPYSFAGRLLIAHELAHVVQQNGSADVVRRAVTYPDPIPTTENPIKRALTPGHIILALTEPTVNGTIIPGDGQGHTNMPRARALVEQAFISAQIEPKNAPQTSGSGGGSGAGSGSGSSGDSGAGSGSGSGSGSAGSGSGGVSVQCGFKDFEVKISAQMRLPTEPTSGSGGQWGPEHVDATDLQGAAATACTGKTGIPVVLKGKPNSHAFWAKVVANENEHVSDFRAASRQFLEPLYQDIMAQRGTGSGNSAAEALDACKGGLRQRPGLDLQKIDGFLNKVEADIHRRDVPGGHENQATTRVVASCPRIEITVEPMPAPAGATQAPAHGPTR
jgi:hypothetical protein